MQALAHDHILCPWKRGPKVSGGKFVRTTNERIGVKETPVNPIQDVHGWILFSLFVFLEQAA
jgi:hypothetical protein